ncbi:type IV pilin protein [Sanyastnella coralliicola]|uniref:type IV pilin protein n=1 Tax=Sanyastnella coralliicola TaxID=3069118 RepID=UPI0027BA7395|nr:type IV pilin protein [Longitalea sp. SCSIO 12813]
MNESKLRALTLMELLIVLAIIGIIILMALPNFTGLISNAHSLEAQQQLGIIHSFQKTYFFTHSKYSEDLNAIHFEENKLVTQGGNGKYDFEIVNASPNSFLARATAVVDFDGDGEYNVWEIDQDKTLREVVPD